VTTQSLRPRRRAPAILRWLLTGLAGLVLLAAVLAVGALGWLAARQHRNAEAWAIHDPRGVQEERFVRIGGVEQWVTIRGEDRANPVILIVGGTGRDGPGTVFSPFVAAFRPWERDFTVVQWDMRGAGKTFARAGRRIEPGLSLDRLTADGLELTDYLRKRLGKRTLVLLGADFGSTVATKMALARPEAFSAYVGVGQASGNRAQVERAGYDRLVGLATAHRDAAALADLKLAGPDAWRPPRDPARVAAFVRVSTRYHAPNPPDQTLDVLTAPHWSVLDAYALKQGMAASEPAIGLDWAERFDFASLGPEFKVPVFVIQGDQRLDAPTPLAAAWLERIRAPEKRLVVIAGAGNHGLQTHGAAHLAALNRYVRPLAVATQ
jgi:pimeloyl-ACP methyl ester carboxylesterase